MRLLFEVRHPAHVHHFAPLISYAESKGHLVQVVATEKDITASLLREYGIDAMFYGRAQNGVLRKLTALLRQDFNMVRILHDFKPDVVIGRPSHPLCFISWLLGIPSLIFAEDDVKSVIFNALLAHPFANVIVSPVSTDLYIFQRKKIPYTGTQKLAYINHHADFVNEDIIRNYGLKKPYFILRTSSLSAGHDINAKGLAADIITRLCNDLSKRGEVYISAEGRLPAQLESKRLKISHNHIYSVLVGATCFISDSQSMTIEASLLGVPNVRYSSFVGKLNAFNDFEKLDMTRSVHATRAYEALIEQVDSLLEEPNLQKRMVAALRIYYSDKTDLTEMSKFFIDQLSTSNNKKQLLLSWKGSEVYKRFYFTD